MHSSKPQWVVYDSFGTLIKLTMRNIQVPPWNQFSRKLSKKVAIIASKYVADNGWYITLSSTDHFGIVSSHAIEMGFKMMHTILILIPDGYVRKTIEIERVSKFIC